MYQVKNVDGSWSDVRGGEDVLDTETGMTWLRYITSTGVFGIASPSHWRFTPRGR